jgi:hypothetical protein
MAAEAEVSKEENDKRLAQLQALSWLADVPLFIDEDQVARFFDFF